MKSFLIGMLGLFLLQYSIFKMKEILNYKNQSKLRRIFGSPNEGFSVIIKFIKSMSYINDSKMRNQYIGVALLHILGFIIFMGEIIYVIKYEQ